MLDTLTKPEPTWEIAHLYPAQGAWSEEQIHLSVLEGDTYVEHGVFSSGKATSVLLTGFSVDVNRVFSR